MTNKFTKLQLIEAFNSAKNNREQIMAGERCGCFSCKNIFLTNEIDYWILNEIRDTALCPYCYLDSVLGEKSGFPITNEFLTAMNNYWYNGNCDVGWEWWFFKRK